MVNFNDSIILQKYITSRNTLFYAILVALLLFLSILVFAVIRNPSINKLAFLLIFTVITAFPLFYYRFKKVNIDKIYALKRFSYFDNAESLFKLFEKELKNSNIMLSGGYKITDNFVILNAQLGIKWFMLKEIVWVYISKNKTTVNFIPVYESYDIKLHSSNNEVLTLGCSNQQYAQKILEELYYKVPNAKFGYDQ